MTEIDEKGGYDVEFVGNEPHNVTCCICLLVLREPMQAEQCGHRFCESCVEDLKNSQNGKIICPEDREVINVFKDKGRKREILNLIVKCSNHKHGCTVTKELRDLQDHLKNCEFQLIQCPFENCKIQLQRNLLAKHKMERHNEDRVDLLEKKFEQAMQRIEGLSQENQSKTQQIEQAMQRIEDFSQENQSKTQEIEQAMQGIKSLSRENQSKTQEIELAMQRIASFEQETQSLKTKLEFQESRLQLKTQEIDRLKQTIEAVNYSSYIWKVNQFAKKFRREQQDPNCEPQTRTFFTSKGYRINCELHLNGYGDQWDKKLSIFFRPEPGTFDDTLQWPMKAVFTALLLSDGIVKEQYSFDTKNIPKKSRVNFQQPHEFNTGGSDGFSFTDVSKLNGYCVSDSITIKIDISHY